MRSLSRFFIYPIVLLLFLITGCGTSSTAQQATTKPAKKPVVIEKEIPTPTKAIPTFIVSPVVTVTASVPTRLVIPSINVDAPVENVNITSNGDLGTPQKNQWEGVGWYSNGPRPGESGSAVIDGHLDRPGGYPAVFWYLNQVQVGDIIMVVDAKGKTLRFRVTRTAAYPPLASPLQDIFGYSEGTNVYLRWNLDS